MYLETKDIIHAPLEEVFKLVRDDLPKIVPFLPNVKKIEVKSLEPIENNKKTKIVNHWYADIEVPAVAKSFVSDELFSWKDKAIWFNDQYFVEYELESFWANDLYEARGKNYFRALNDKETELRVTCDVVIHAEKVPGVPKFLVKKVLPTVEAMIQKILQPNLSGLGKGINEYFRTR